MKSYIKYFLLIFFLLTVISCEKNFKESVEESYNVALLNGDCDYLENYYASLDAAGKEYSAEEAYFYASTISNCSDFNTIALLSTESNDIYTILAAYLSKEYLTQDELEFITLSQERILYLCNTNMIEEVEVNGVITKKYFDIRADVLCSLTNVASSSLETIQATSFISNTKVIPLSQKGIADSMKSLVQDGAFKDKASIIKSIENFFDIKAGQLGNSSKEEAMQQVADKVLSAKNNQAFKDLVGASIGNDIDKYVEEITVEKDGKRVVTSESLANYLESILK